MLVQARATSESRFLQRLSGKRQSSAIQRALFASLRCPLTEHFSTPADEELERVRLLRHIELLPFDFQSCPSVRRAELLRAFQEALRSRNANEAESLAAHLLGLASKHRDVGGSISLETILASVRGRYSLVDYPDHAADWGRIRQRSDDALSRIREVVGTNHQLDCSAAVQRIVEGIAAEKVVVIAGESGSGKSALAKRVAGPIRSSLVWMTAEDLDIPSLRKLREAWHLESALDELLSMSAAERVLLVFDGIERFSADALANVSNLIRSTMVARESPVVRVLVTTEYGAVGRITGALVAVGLSPEAIRVESIGAPDRRGVRRILRRISSLNAIADRTDMLDLLQNLKLLDCVVRAAEGGRLPSELDFVGTTTVINWVWEHWIGAEKDRHVKGGVLKKLGTADGDWLGTGLDMHRMLEPADLEALTSRELCPLISIRNDKCYFSHDLIADWARFRVLIAGSAIDRQLAEKAQLPRWHKAIRLFGQHVIESNPGNPDPWRDLLSRLIRGENPSAASDLVLEAVFLSAKPGIVLEQVWPDLQRDKGELLRRLLRQFLTTASVADPRFVALAGSLAQAHEFASEMRLPYFPLWPPMLRFLHAHIEEAVQLAFGQLARIAKMWLESVPIVFGDGSPYPGREAAAGIAIALARELQFYEETGGVVNDEIAEIAFGALLLAAPDSPRVVGELVLELAQRRDHSAYIAERIRQHDEAKQEVRNEYFRSHPEQLKKLMNRAGTLSLGRPMRRPRPPWPDGPRRRVDDAFQAACYNNPQAFQSLISAAPEIAQEVALAVCIEHPGDDDSLSRSSALLDDRRGLAFWPAGSPAAYFKGCFWTFLRENVALGLDLIIRLVDFATERWCETQRRYAEVNDPNEAQQREVIMLFEDGTRRALIGDGRVFAWYRTGNGMANAPTCALMALEKWLYDEADAGRDIRSWVIQILHSARSVGFLGVLSSLGLRHPELFRGVLFPVLGVWQIYGWHEDLKRSHPYVWRIELGGPRVGRDLRKLLQEWHELPHRSSSLLERMVVLFVGDGALAERFAAIRAMWNSQRYKVSGFNDLELLLARTDRANYTETEIGEGRTRIELQIPEPLKSQLRELEKQAERHILLKGFGMRARELLDQGDRLDESSADKFWNKWRFVIEGDKSGEESAEATCAFAAVWFALISEEWRRRNENRNDIVLSRLRAVFEHPPPLGDLPIAESILPWGWDRFAAESLVALVSLGVTDLWIRTKLAEFVMAFHYQTTEMLMRAAFKARESLGCDWPRLQNLALVWAALRACLERAHSLTIDVAGLQHWRARLAASFATGVIQTRGHRWARVARLGQRLYAQIESAAGIASPRIAEPRRETARVARSKRTLRRHRRSGPGLDVQVVQAAFNWIPELGQAKSERERTNWIGCAKDALTVTLSMMPDEIGPDEEVEGTPYQFDCWMFALVARTLAQLRSNESAEQLWLPILKMGAPAHYWVSAFFDTWFIDGLRAAPTPDAFVLHWRELARYCLSSPEWAPGTSRRNFRLDDLVCEAMGLSDIALASQPSSLRSIVKAMYPEYKRFTELWLHVPRVTTRFADFVRLPVARDLLEDGIVWLGEAVAKFTDYDWSERGLEDAILGALRTCCFECRVRLKDDSQFQRRFTAILNRLIQRQNAGAIALNEVLAKPHVDPGYP